MGETAALLADEVLPERRLRQCVLSLPHALRYLLTANPAALTQVLGVVYRTIARYLIRQAGLTHNRAATGAVTLSQRFGSALNLSVHFHMLFLDGVYLFRAPTRHSSAPWQSPSANELQGVVEQIAACAIHRGNWRLDCFYRFPPQMPGDAHGGAGHAYCMDAPSDDDLFLDAVDHVVLEALAAIGNDPQGRFAFFRRLLSAAQETVRGRDSRPLPNPARTT